MSDQIGSNADQIALIIDNLSVTVYASYVGQRLNMPDKILVMQLYFFEKSVALFSYQPAKLLNGQRNDNNYDLWQSQTRINILFFYFSQNMIE
jgi:hypothetical protein